jgi:Helicase conserved C-terminal domain
MENVGLRGLVINSDTIQEARLRKEDLWKQAETGPNILFMALEQLISKDFNDLIKEDGPFAARVCAIAVDEVHLLNTWGKGWRKAFQQIGWVRARFSNVVLIALTATMRGGVHTESVCKYLGLHRGQFHFIRRSNARSDIRILFRTMKSGMGGRKFPELDWVLREKRKTLIFCRTIHLGWRIHKYLCEQSDDPKAEKHIRLYNALNAPTFNAETRKMMEENDMCLITVGTDTMSVGVDLSCIRDVLIIGEPEDVDDLFQKFGRAGRNRTLVTDARGMLYLGPGAQDSAKRIVDAKLTNDHGKLRKGDTMDISLAEMVLASCKVDEQNRQYSNPTDETLCGCLACREHPPQSRVQPCNCSGCTPELSLVLPLAEKTSKSTSSIPKAKRLTKIMRALGTRKLIEFRLAVWERADEKQFGLLPPPVFLPDLNIKLLLDCFALVTTVDELKYLLRHNQLICGNLDELFAVICNIENEFKHIRLLNKEKERAGRARTAAKKRAITKAANQVALDLLAVRSGTGSSSEDVEDEDDGGNSEMSVDGGAIAEPLDSGPQLSTTSRIASSDPPIMSPSQA